MAIRIKGIRDLLVCANAADLEIILIASVVSRPYPILDLTDDSKSSFFSKPVILVVVFLLFFIVTIVRTELGNLLVH